MLPGAAGRMGLALGIQYLLWATGPRLVRGQSPPLRLAAARAGGSSAPSVCVRHRS